MTKQVQFKQLLNESQLKATKPRLSVLKILDKASSPLSITDIQGNLKSETPDTATLYRIVQQLKEKGLLTAVNMQHNHAHYELTTKQHHHHVICMKCNKVTDLDECLLESVQKLAKQQSGFSKISEHSLEFFGLCKHCAKKSENN